MIEYQLKSRCFVHARNKDSLESIIERINDALGRTHIHDVNFGECHLVNEEWQNIPNEKLTSNLESAYDKIRDLKRRVRAAWQTINRLDPRRCVPALKELDAVLNVSKFGEVGYGM